MSCHSRHIRISLSNTKTLSCHPRYTDLITVKYEKPGRTFLDIKISLPNMRDLVVPFYKCRSHCQILETWSCHFMNTNLIVRYKKPCRAILDIFVSPCQIQKPCHATLDIQISLLLNTRSLVVLSWI